MLYLKSLTLDRFKSFRHSEILISRGFTCVVGPNGSGKSNICDALLFGLGENSLSRLRISRFEELINFGMKRKKGEIAKAHVKLEFGGDEEYAIVRTARSDGKTEYRVNGKRMTRGEVLEILHANRIKADETSTITQGEIGRIISLSPKEHRELIDIAAGIKEFEAKKADALRELEKVSQRISEAQGMLNEKVGFLRELEKEKEAAEHYAALTAKLRTLRYSILMARKEALVMALDGYTKEMAVVDSKRNETEVERSGIAKRINDLETERQGITNELAANSAEAGKVNSRFEAVNTELATLGAEINGHRSSLIEIGSFVEDAEKEIAGINKTVEAGKRSIAELEAKLKKLEAEAGATVLGGGKGEDEKEIEAINRKIQELERRIAEGQDALIKLRTEASITEKAAKEAGASKARLAALLNVRKAEGSKLAEELERLRKGAKDAAEGLGRMDSAHKRAGQEMDRIDERLITLKEQRSEASARTGGLLERISTNFSEADGFYGRVSQLCTYDSADALAVESAAGSRFEYFVVDTISTADRIIEYLKKNQLGRATFIPVRDVNVDGREEGDTTAGLRPVLGLIKYDSRFDRAFRYVFGNSYVIKGIGDARKAGVGRHRYVTLDGDLVELSGTVSGGSSKRKLSLSSIENQIRTLEEQKKKLHSEIEKAEGEAFAARKAQASLEMSIEAMEKRLPTALAEMGDAERSMALAENEERGLVKRLGELKQESARQESQLDAAGKELSVAREKLRKAYSEAIAATKELARSGSSKAEKERAERARKEAEGLMISIAGTRKEMELLGARKAEIERQIDEKRLAGKSINASILQKSGRIALLEAERKEIESGIKRSSNANSKSVERLNRITDELARLGEDNGRINAQLNEVDRQLADARVKRSQTETRLNDVAAELAAYVAKPELIKGDAEVMSREADVVQARLNDLGTVNMKAPEVYAERRKDVDDALQKSNTLEAEKQAVIRMIEEIDSKKLQIFMSTFNDVNRNFSRLYKYIFPGDAHIELDNPSEPFSGGIEIKITDASLSKALKSMSGGQKSLILLMMLFAIHLCKPSSLYVFDEVDASLDRENSKKLSQLIKEMSSEAQFAVVSHNDSLIINADAAIGVVMSGGESKTVGLEVSSITKRA